MGNRAGCKDVRGVERPLPEAGPRPAIDSVLRGGIVIVVLLASRTAALSWSVSVSVGMGLAGVGVGTSPDKLAICDDVGRPRLEFAVHLVQRGHEHALEMGVGVIGVSAAPFSFCSAAAMALSPWLPHFPLAEAGRGLMANLWAPSIGEGMNNNEGEGNGEAELDVSSWRERHH